jgi:uncharacterized protein YecE (DUF72 family)
MGWSYSFWKGPFYPAELTSKEFLTYYAKKFDTVEVDSTFYRIPREQTIEEWKKQTPQEFLFSLKFPQKITHMKMLQDSTEDTNVFIKRISQLGKKLGALLLQFPPTFRLQHLSLLTGYLETLPKGFKYAVEIRNKSLLSEELYRILRDNNVALTWVDSPKMPIAKEVTADFLYVRWEGDRKRVIGTESRVETNRVLDIKNWVDRLKPFLDRDLLVLGYFSKYYSGFPPSDVKELLDRIKTIVSSQK